MKKNILIFGALNTTSTFLTVYLSIHSTINAIVLAVVPLVLMLLLGIVAAYFYKRHNPQKASFRNLFLTILGGLGLGYVLGTLLIVLYFLSLSEETKVLLENKYLENQFIALSHLSNSISFFDTLEKASEELFNIKFQLLGILNGGFISAFYATIIALCMKREYE